MTETIIAAIIAAAVTLTVCLINNYFQQKRFEEQREQQQEAVRAKHDETIKLISYKLDQLEKKTDLHNNAVERLYIAEKQIRVNEERFNGINVRLKHIEGQTKI